MVMTSTGAYRVPAIVVTDSGEIAVDADLRIKHSHPLPGWRGHVTADAREDFWPVVQAGNGMLRLPDGREGIFISDHTSVGSGRMTITGSGPAPF